MNVKNFSAFFFDLDGTLVDSAPDILSLIRLVLEEAALPVPDMDTTLIGPPLEDIMAAIFSSQVVLQLVHTSRYTAERSRFANCFCNGQARMAQSLPGLRCWTCVCIA